MSHNSCEPNHRQDFVACVTLRAASSIRRLGEIGMFRAGASSSASFQFSAGKVSNLSHPLTRSFGTQRSVAIRSRPQALIISVYVSIARSMVIFTLYVKVKFTRADRG